ILSGPDGSNPLQLTSAAFNINSGTVYNFTPQMQVGLDNSNPLQPFAFFGISPGTDLVHLGLTPAQYTTLTGNSSFVVLSPLPVTLFGNPVGTSFPGNNNLLIFSALNNNTGTLVVSSAVPELSTWAMMLIGFAGIGFAAYRRAKKAALAAA